jgi:predicted transcriptional regulator of viral defense system
MSSLLEKQLQSFASDYLTYADLCALLPISDNARYAQIKRALKEGYLIRLRKGIYRRGKYLEKNKPHPFEMSQHILWPSYVSLESALSYHELIPEAVYNTTCVTLSRSQLIQNEFGLFSYKPLPKKHFFVGVVREVDNKDIFLIASPWKAITDYVYCYKKDWTTLTPMMESLRIDSNLLPELNSEFAKKLITYYDSKRIQRFLTGIVKSFSL